MSELKNQISQFIDTNAKIYQDISLAIHAKPEVSDFEYFAFIPCVCPTAKIS